MRCIASLEDIYFELEHYMGPKCAASNSIGLEKDLTVEYGREFWNYSHAKSRSVRHLSKNPEGSTHRVITVIEEQKLFILGSTALFTKVGQLHMQMIGTSLRGRGNFLFV